MGWAGSFVGDHLLFFFVLLLVGVFGVVFRCLFLAMF